MQLKATLTITALLAALALTACDTAGSGIPRSIGGGSNNSGFVLDETPTTPDLTPIGTLDPDYVAPDPDDLDDIQNSAGDNTAGGDPDFSGMQDSAGDGTGGKKPRGDQNNNTTATTTVDTPSPDFDGMQGGAGS